MFGLVGIPSQAAYNSAKFAVRGFSESLRIELDAAKSGVSSTVVHPGGIKTNIARNGRVDDSEYGWAGSREAMDKQFDRIAFTSPKKAAREILGAVRANRRRTLIGADAHAIDFLARLPFSFLTARAASRSGASRRPRR